MGLSNKMEKTLVDYAKRRRQAIEVELELLPVCNLNCRMCYIHTDMKQVQALGGLKNIEEWLALAKQLKESEVLFLLLTGGEVFLYPRFRLLYEQLYDMGFVITINTNATMITQETVVWLQKRPPKLLSISLYAADESGYERVTGQRGVFAKVDSALHMLRAANIRFELKTMITPYNVSDIEKMHRYRSQFGVYFRPATYAFPSVRKQGSTEASLRFSPEEAAQAAIDIDRCANNELQFAKLITDYMRRYADSKDLPANALYGFTCGSCNTAAWITWQGHMTPCALINEPYTLPFEQGFLPAWEELKRKCDAILMSPKCSHCDKRDVCSVCPAANLAETGSYQEASPYHCRMTEYKLDWMQRYMDEHGLSLENKEE